MKNLFNILIISLGLGVSSASSAGIILSNYESLTTDGQNGTELTASAAQVGNYDTYTLNIIARGDFGDTANEWLNFSLNDHNIMRADYSGFTSLGDFWYDVSGVIDVTWNNTFNNSTDWDYTLDISLDIDATDLISDLPFHGNALEVDWLTGPDSDVAAGWDFYVDWELVGSNDVPEPSILALMGAGLIGLGFTRRRRKLEA